MQYRQLELVLSLGGPVGMEGVLDGVRAGHDNSFPGIGSPDVFDQCRNRIQRRDRSLHAQTCLAQGLQGAIEGLIGGQPRLIPVRMLLQ